MRRSIVLVAIAVMVIALVPTAASAQVSDETLAALAELEAAVDGLGGDTVEDWATGLAAVQAAADNLAAVNDGELDLSGLDAALGDLGTAIEGGDLDEIAAAGDAVGAAVADVRAQADAQEPAEPEEPEEEEEATTTTATPSGGVATGAGGTADTTTFPLGVFAAAGIISLLLAGMYALGRRSEG